MQRFILVLLSTMMSLSSLQAEPEKRNSTIDPMVVERSIIELSANLDAEINELSQYKNLRVFCNDDQYRQTIFSLLDQLHNYHEILEKDLKGTNYRHSRRVIRRILRHLEKLESRYSEENFAAFFSDHCLVQRQLETDSDHYRAGFAHHSYDAKVYNQEVSLFRYLKRLNRRVQRIERHVDDFHIRRKVWEHG